ncbi:MAG TPA: hypothetical protein VD927_02720 [Chryseosolibacter sp.]|nr:hypothetical protein [Chryseosolibacter sp.]
MRTRQLRLNSIDEIRKKLPMLAGQHINIVLADRTVLPGTLKRADASSIELTNSRHKTSTIKLESITEMYFDTIEC